MKHDEMKVLESSIVPIYERSCIDGSNLHEQVVDARDIWKFLESKYQYTDWIKRRIDQYGFKENIDYCIFSEVSEKRGRPSIRYIVTIDTAKELGMLEANDKGRMIRRYFIESEKHYRELKIIRTRAKAERRLFTDILKEVLPESPNKKWAYKQYTDLIYKHVTGYNAKQLRELNDKPKDFNVRELLTPQQLKEVLKYEGIIQGLLQLGQDYQGVKAILENPAAFLPETAVKNKE